MRPCHSGFGESNLIYEKKIPEKYVFKMSHRSSTERLAQEKASKLGIELLPLKDLFAEI